MAGAVDHPTWNDQPVAAGCLCCEHGADGLGSAAVYAMQPTLQLAPRVCDALATTDLVAVIDVITLRLS